MVNLLSQSRSCLLAVGIALIDYTTLVTTAQASISEEIDKLDNKDCLNISSCDKFYSNFMVNHNFISANIDKSISRSPQKKLLEDSRDLIDKIEDPQIKTEMLINLALQYYELNELDITKQILNGLPT